MQRSSEKKLYQLIIARLEGANVLDNQYRDRIFKLVQQGIGGFILFGGKRDEIGKFIEELNSISEKPLFIASDIERGVGQQIEGMSSFPCNMAVASAINPGVTEDVIMLEDMIAAIAREAKEVGINMPLIPVLDVNKNPDNPIICTRAFSDDPHKVAWFGSKFISILEKEGLISCAKHFPGHGDTSVDSHISLPLISKSLQEMYNADLIPFKKAIEAKVSAVMIGHLSLPAIDSVPSTISENTIKGLLRKKLGFEGLILTDALNMKALKNIENIPVKCLLAGANILLHPNSVEETVFELEKALESGELDEELIDSSVGYIIRAKQALQDVKKHTINYIYNDMLSKKIISKSIVLIKDQEGILPIRNFDDCRIFFAGDRNFFDISVFKDYFKNISDISDVADNQEEIAIITIFSSVAAWRGSSGISSLEIKKVKGIIKRAKKTVIISFGSPYILRHFQEAGVLIAAFESLGYYQQAIIRMLRGLDTFTGQLPVRLYEI